MPRLLLAAVAVVLGAAPAAGGTGGAHCLISLAEYIDSSIGPFYLGGEGVGTQFSIVEIPQQDCYAVPQANYHANNGTATNGTDFVLPDGETPVDGEITVPVPVTDDDAALAESAVETATVVLTADNAVVARPPTIPLYVVDADGEDRVTLFATSAAQVEGRSQVSIPVFRAGPALTPIAVDYSIAPGSASPDLDYEAPSEGTLSFVAGVRMQLIQFTIKEDALGESDETVQVALQPGAGYELESSASLTLTILDNEESLPPVSRFHHPRNGWTYSRNDYRIREMHVFARDEGTADVAMVEMALRKKKTDGSCSWWNDQARRWEAGACSDRRWVTMSLLGPYTPTWPWLYEEDFPRLTPSIGTGVKSYTAWCRATDGAGNVEALPFERGRNWNTFEVKR